MNTFLRGFNYGFINGACNNMYAFNPCARLFSYNPFGCCFNMPLFFTPSYNFGSFNPYPQTFANFNIPPVNFYQPSPVYNFSSSTFITPSYTKANTSYKSYSSTIGDTFEKTQKETSITVAKKNESTNSSISLKKAEETKKTYSSTKFSAQSSNSISKKDCNTYNDIILKYSKKYDVDPNLVKAMIKQESNFNPKAISSAGAKGLMQLMPDTANSLGVKVDLEKGIDNRNNPELNIMGGVKYISEQLKTFNGDVRLALAAYNAGPGNVKKDKTKPPQIPNNKETPKYVSKVMNYYNEYKAA